MVFPGHGSPGAARGKPWARCLVLALAGTFAGGGVAAAQTLPEFLGLARQHALELDEARNLAGEAASRRAAAGRALLPSLTATGRYRASLSETTATLPTGPDGEPEEVVLVPRNQLSATASIEIPIIDVAAWQGRRGAQALAEAARHAVGQADNEIARRVAEAYYQHVGASALVISSEASVDAAVAHRSVVEARLDAGLATELDLERASAQVARSRQALAEAELARTDAARTLRVLTGVSPSNTPPLEMDPAPEAPLETWLAGAEELPRVRAARAEARAASSEARSAELFYVPNLSVFGEERYTSGVGFAEPEGLSAGVTLEWRFDLASFQLAEAERGAARASVTRAEIALRDARTDIEAAWQRVHALRARAEAAESEAAATARAAEIARAEYPARASQLDVIVAERDALSAEVERIRAAADLAFARAWLRIAAGRADELER